MPTDDAYNEQEAQRRFEAALKAGLTTPPLLREDVPAKRSESKRDAKPDAKAD